MADHSRRSATQQQGEQQSPDARESAQAGAGNAAMQDVLNDRTQRARAISLMQTWVAEQLTALQGLQGAERATRAEAVLGTLESSWNSLLDGASVDTLKLPAVPSTAPGPALNVPLPPELIGEVRPIITMLESGPITDASGGPEASAHNGTDWNARLGVPQYRTQSDNLVAPEATCNTTTLAMIMERLGMGREDVVEALDERIKKRWITAALKARKLTAERAAELRSDLSKVDDEEGWDREAEWKKASRRYIDSKMKDKSYRRVRGASATSKEKRDEIAGQMLGNAQLEDLLDMLAHESGLSRYGIVSEPDKILAEVSNTGLPAEGDKIWGGASWKKIHDSVQTTLEAGGAAALSFHHKGTRDKGASHIVSIQEVQSGGFVVDDPYGEVRATYNPKKYDDAYFGSSTYQQRVGGKMVTKERIIHERTRKNQKNGFDDWGAAAARQLDANESKGRDSFMTKDQITRGMKYITLFQRGKRVPRPKPRPENLGQ